MGRRSTTRVRLSREEAKKLDEFDGVAQELENAKQEAQALVAELEDGQRHAELLESELAGRNDEVKRLKQALIVLGAKSVLLSKLQRSERLVQMLREEVSILEARLPPFVVEGGSD